jgi:hypothetical protein
MKESEFKQHNTSNLKSEYGMNNRKLRFNRGSAAEAVVSNVSDIIIITLYDELVDDR